MVYRWVLERVRARKVYDEKWIKIRGRWRYWFVVMDVERELLVLAALLPSCTPWACRWIGCQLKRIKKIPRVIITDGLAAYEHLLDGAIRVLLCFLYQLGVTVWLKKRFSEDGDILKRKTLMKKLFQTNDKGAARPSASAAASSRPGAGHYRLD